LVIDRAFSVEYELVLGGAASRGLGGAMSVPEPADGDRDRLRAFIEAAKARDVTDDFIVRRDAVDNPFC